MLGKTRGTKILLTGGTGAGLFALGSSQLKEVVKAVRSAVTEKRALIEKRRYPRKIRIREGC